VKRSKFSAHQIIAILKAVEAGRTVRDVCREREVSDATYCLGEVFPEFHVGGILLNLLA
jgi:hypothetical protein